MSAQETFAQLLAQITPAQLADCIVERKSILGSFEGSSRDAVRNFARQYRFPLLATTPSRAVTQLVEQRPDFAVVLDTPAGREWMRDELKIAKAMAK